ncbi:MAG: hypothetical protein KME18_18110 [Phormidium tanganyikae FI6-MK23]|jgi:hypothetical protein|nr:hypothetical protein [Phormidium tanganyikae FI6-MK23]
MNRRSERKRRQNAQISLPKNKNLPKGQRQLSDWEAALVSEKLSFWDLIDPYEKHSFHMNHAELEERLKNTEMGVWEFCQHFMHCELPFVGVEMNPDNQKGSKDIWVSLQSSIEIVPQFKPS